MSNSFVHSEIERLCNERSLRMRRDVVVGPYVAPVLIEAFDSHATKQNVKIIAEPRGWPPSVAQRMAKSAGEYRDRLCRLAGADFVSLIVEGNDDILEPGGLTSVGELARFLDEFDPPVLDSQPVRSRIRGEPAGPIRLRVAPAATGTYEAKLDKAGNSFTGSSIVFCAMPFATEYDRVFLNLIAPAVGAANLAVLRTDHEESLKSIDRRILEGIRLADLIVADISGHNPNVMYEIGVAHAIGKQTLLIHHDELPCPFDIHYHERMEYSFQDCIAIRERLSERLRGAANALWDL